jgi:hypothetical protein
LMTEIKKFKSPIFQPRAPTLLNGNAVIFSRWGLPEKEATPKGKRA